MTIAMVNTPDNLTCTCLRCGHTWQSDTVRMLLDAGMQVEAEQALAKAPPKRCAACKSPYWKQAPIRKDSRSAEKVEEPATGFATPSGVAPEAPRGDDLGATQ